VTAPDDIVVRLHRHRCVTGIRTVIDDAADEIERLREQLRLANIDNFNTTSEGETLRAERDEARRLVCAQSYDDPRGVARQLGWDCFKEPANAP
jgi:hypothetical protein